MTKKTDQEYKQQLSDIEYRVTREAATERPFTGKYWDHWIDGRYSCVCCNTPFFDQLVSLMQAADGQATALQRKVPPLLKLRI